MDENIYVIGHKNPDTDSICAAISYASLKTLKEEKNIIPARAGNINAQTEFVLNYFGIPSPFFLSDMVPKVSNVMTRNVLFYDRDTSLQEILQVMENKKIRLVPLIDEHENYCGMVSLFDIAHEFCKEANPETCREVFTSIKHIHQALNGKLLNKDKNYEDIFHGVFLVGAMEDISFRKILDMEKAEDCIVITGDRIELQKSAIKKGVKLLIITGGLQVSDEICKLAQMNKINLLISPYDTATTVSLVRLSTPAYRVAQNYDGYLNMDEHLEEARMKIIKAYNRGMAVLDEEKKIVGIATMVDLLKFTKSKIILVDHNEISQAVTGAEHAEIIEIIDHHRLSNPQTIHPIFFLNNPVGSTCTLIARFYFESQITPDSKIAGILLSGIISDTLNLKSPTTTNHDVEMIKKLNEIAKLDLPVYSSQMLTAGINLSGRTPEEIIYNDFKEYTDGKIFFGVGQSEMIGFSEFNNIKSQLIDKIKKIKVNKGYNFVALLATDIATSNSLLIFDGSPNLCHLLGYPIVEPNVAELKGVLSRKKQLLPHLLNIFKDVKPN